MNSLVFANIPHDCREDEFRYWLEEKGFNVAALRLIYDIASSTSPAFARVQLISPPERSAIEALDRQELRGHKVYVRAERLPIFAAAS